ncbi:hypothetical protein P3W85_19845 [Cupriavidus basilensis]|uniref:Integrase n=1 Tax=Cupriavidus basilensis TaxID=68895 RepID=A0ABT6ASG9_9BURK|nr:hypothetical protein [Cupriavidus basilensis]MDF3835197.1 hypothetical protein [Cupriavidus basilensis]
MLLELVQQNGGHASHDTTRRYVTTEAARRMEAMRAVWSPGKGDCAAQIVAPF